MRLPSPRPATVVWVLSQSGSRPAVTSGPQLNSSSRAWVGPGDRDSGYGNDCGDPFGDRPDVSELATPGRTGTVAGVGGTGVSSLISACTPGRTAP